MKEESLKGVCVKAAGIDVAGGWRRERMLRDGGCPHAERKTLLGFTKGWECRFADGNIHTL